MRKLTTPLTEDDVKSLHAGDHVLLSRIHERAADADAHNTYPEADLEELRDAGYAIRSLFVRDIVSLCFYVLFYRTCPLRR